MKKSYHKGEVEITFFKILSEEGVIYKVTRRIPEYSIAETKIFKSKKAAERQFDEWLN